MQKEHTFEPNRARFYTAELLCALECLHGFNVIYRDLKPENILLDYTGHIALCDFGLCKLDMKDQDRTNTFCGTPEYLAPELLNGNGYTKSVDWWTLGVLLFEMVTGLPPYYHENTSEMYKRILNDPLVFPDSLKPSSSGRDPHRDLRDLLTKLLDRDPNARLGAKGAEMIKAHDFFREIDWRKLLARKYEAPFKPNVVSSWRITISSVYLELTRVRRPTNLTQPTSTQNSPRKHPRTATSRARCCHRPCSSNLPAGATTGLLLAWAMLAAASRTPASAAWHDELHTLQRDEVTISMERSNDDGAVAARFGARADALLLVAMHPGRLAGSIGAAIPGGCTSAMSRRIYSTCLLLSW